MSIVGWNVFGFFVGLIWILLEYRRDVVKGMLWPSLIPFIAVALAARLIPAATQEEYSHSLRVWGAYLIAGAFLAAVPCGVLTFRKYRRLKGHRS